jgi:hypothetical protein
VSLTKAELQELMDRTVNATMKVTNVKRDQVVVIEKPCPTTQRCLLATRVIGIFITVLVLNEEGAVKPADIVLTDDNFEVIGKETVVVIYEAEAVDVIPTITISGSAETEVS